MSESKTPIVISKEGCHRCAELKEWLKENDVRYIERDINDEEFVHELLHDDNFLTTFCDRKMAYISHHKIPI